MLQGGSPDPREVAARTAVVIKRDSWNIRNSSHKRLRDLLIAMSFIYTQDI